MEASFDCHSSSQKQRLLKKFVKDFHGDATTGLQAPRNSWTPGCVDPRSCGPPAVRTPAVWTPAAARRGRAERACPGPSSRPAGADRVRRGPAPRSDVAAPHGHTSVPRPGRHVLLRALPECMVAPVTYCSVTTPTGTMDAPPSTGKTRGPQSSPERLLGSRTATSRFVPSSRLRAQTTTELRPSGPSQRRPQTPPPAPLLPTAAGHSEPPRGSHRSPHGSFARSPATGPQGADATGSRAQPRRLAVQPRTGGCGAGLDAPAGLCPPGQSAVPFVPTPCRSTPAQHPRPQR